MNSTVTANDTDLLLAAATQGVGLAFLPVSATIIAEKSWHDATFDLNNLNGQHFLTMTGFVNRRREEGDLLELLLSIVSRRLPGAWGLIYERDDE